MNQNKTQFGGKFRAILMLLAFVIVGVGFTTMLNKEVTLVYNGEDAVYNTTSTTVKDFLTERDIELVENIYLKPAADTQIQNGMTITVRDPKEVIVLDNGEERTIKTGNLKVADILKEHEYELKDQDYTVPNVDEELDFTEEKPLIIINRVYHKTVSEVVAIPYEVETRENNELLKGKSKVIQEGQDGSKIVVTGMTIMNGFEVESHTISEEIVNKAKNRIIEVGTKVEEKVEAPSLKTGGTKGSDDGSGYINGRKIKKVITMNATAYDASYASNGQWAGVTAMGTKLRPGVVAVDRNVIPLGSTLYVESTDGWPSYGMASAEDVGGAIKGNKIDLFFESSTTVRKFGRRTVKVYVLE